MQLTEGELSLLRNLHFDESVVAHIRKHSIAGAREYDQRHAPQSRAAVVARRPGRFRREDTRAHCWTETARAEQIAVLEKLARAQTENFKIIDIWINTLRQPNTQEDLDFIKKEEELELARVAEHNEYRNSTAPQTAEAVSGLLFIFSRDGWIKNGSDLEKFATAHGYKLAVQQSYNINMSFDDDVSAHKYLDEQGFDVRPDLRLQPFWWERLGEGDAWRSWYGHETIRKSSDGFFELLWPAQKLLELPVTQTLLTIE